MRESWHIFKKDVRYLRLEIVLVLAMIAIFTSIVRNGSPYGMDIAGVIPGAWIVVLFSIAATYLMARVVQAEAIPGDTQFWITRPYNWKSLLAAKIAFVIVFANVPILLSRLVIIAAAGFPILPSLPGLLWSQSVMFMFSQLSVLAVASLTPGIVSFIVSSLALTFVLSNSVFRSRTDAFMFPSAWIGASIVIATIVAFAIPILVLQYRHRSTRISRVLGIACVVLLIMLIAQLSYTWELQAQTWISRHLSQTSPIQISVDASQLPAVHGVVPPDPETKFVEVDIPLIVNNIPDGQEVQLDAIDIWYETADGNPRHFDLAGIGRGSALTRAQPVAEREIYIESSFFNAEKARPGTLRASIFATLFGNPTGKVVRIQSQPVSVMKDLQCYRGSRYGIDDEVRCRSALRWPRQLVVAKFDDFVGPIGPLPSYSPFPGEMNLNPIDDRAVGPKPSGSTIEVTIFEPLAHVRRDVEVKNFRLADFVAVSK